MSVVDLENVRSIEFGVCLDDPDGENYVLVPVDGTVQIALVEMAKNSANQIGCFPDCQQLPFYEPSEKYASTECLRYAIQGEDAEMMPVRLFNAANIATQQHRLTEPMQISFYFAIFHDAENRKLMAIRRAIQFKGVLKAKGRLIHWIDDTMKLVEDHVFKLDEDFDYLVTSDEIYILRPASFVYTADLMSRVLAKAEANTQALHQTMDFVDFAGLTGYATIHPRAARLVAAIRSRDDLDGITKATLKAMCDQTGIELQEENGKLFPIKGQEMDFLQLLDRRRYSLTLVENTPETYEAASRRQV
jgi:hypothetical protein